MNRSWIPNGITMAALGCGVLAILFILRAIAAGGAGPDWVYGAALIFLSGLLDGLDGRFARLLNASSRFGKDLDALTDIVSMSLAPALLVYQRAFAGDRHHLLWMLLTTLFVCCAAARLARFSQEEGRGRFYTGVPTTAACAVMCGVAVLAPELGTPVVAIAVLLVAVLMISTLPFPTPEVFILGMPTPLRIILAAIFLAGAILGQAWFFATPLIYVAYGLVLYLLSILRVRVSDTRS